MSLIYLNIRKSSTAGNNMSATLRKKHLESTSNIKLNSKINKQKSSFDKNNHKSIIHLSSLVKKIQTLQEKEKYHMNLIRSTFSKQRYEKHKYFY